MVESWQLKIRRAQHHLEDITTRLTAVVKPGRRPFRVESDHRADGLWHYSLHVDANADEMLPVVIGDYLFNLRSALDHIAVASGNDESQFPIFTFDIRKEPAEGRETQRVKRARAKWNYWTAGMKPDVLTTVEFVQPYNAPERGYHPDDEILALLQSFQNADKHRELNIVVAGVENGIAQFPGSPPHDFRTHAATAGIPEGMMPDGAVFLTHPNEVDVQFIGEAVIALTRGPELGHRRIPQFLDDMMLEVVAMIGAIEPAM